MKSAREIETGKDEEIINLKNQLNEALSELNELKAIFLEKIEENEDLDDQIEIKRIQTIELRKEIDKLKIELNEARAELQKCKSNQ